MEVNDIDKYFSYDILRRGYNYYKKGRVKSITKSDDTFSAKVSGTEEYKVTIIIDELKHDIKKLKCTCPYAEESNCKHMASVLYCIKNNDLPIKEKPIRINSEEITDFEKFKREYKKECYKLFHNRYYLHSNEIDDYVSIVNSFVVEGTKYINENINVAYQIFEFFLREIDGIDVYDEYGQKEELFANLFESFKEILANEKMFIKLLSFINMIFTINSDKYYYEHKDNIINLLYQYIENDWQARDTLILFNKLDKNRDIYDFYKTNIRTKIIYINYYFISKEQALKLGVSYLNINEVCDFLLKNTNDNDGKIELLEKIINTKNNYADEKYYNMLLSLYKDVEEDKYIDLLKRYFSKYSNMKTYHMIKEYYSAKEWIKVRNQYLKIIRDNKLYYKICIEEECYDELIEALKGKWIEDINECIDALRYHRPKELLQLYKDTILNDLRWSADRKKYQKIISNFKNFNKIPNGRTELENIIKYIREKYKNRKALQEEVDFYEETYL